MNFLDGVTASRHEIRRMTKQELKHYLESRGYYVAQGESIKEMRETALADWHEERKGSKK